MMPKKSTRPFSRMTWEPRKSGGGYWYKEVVDHAAGKTKSGKPKRRKSPKQPAPAKFDREAEKAAWEAWLIWEAEWRLSQQNAKPHAAEYAHAIQYRTEMKAWVDREFVRFERTGVAPASESVPTGTDSEPELPDPDEWEVRLVGWRDELAASWRSYRRTCSSRTRPR